MTLVIRLLGPIQLSRDDQPIQIRGYQPLALLAYLLVTGQAHTRQHLVDLCFDRADDPRASLRWTLSELRRAIGGGYILADRQDIAFNFESDYWLDVPAFEAGQVEHYRGDFLEGLRLREVFRFEDWVFFERERLRERYQTTLAQHLALLERQGDDAAIVETAHRLLRLDNLREEWYRVLIQAYARLGQQAAALRQYQVCLETLKTELGVPPAPETTALYEQIRTGKIKPDELLPPPTSARRPPRHNLPAQTTSFIGREAELADIKRLLLDEPGCRLLNLVGPGGIGKTRLALAAAEQTFSAFPDGVYFVSLAPIGEVEFIVSAMAEALKLTFYGKTDPKDQLLDYLSQKRLLLVADNFEHLLDGASLLSDILSMAPGVTLLVTSQERLKLQEEWGYEVQGLPFPSGVGQTSEVSAVVSDFGCVVPGTGGLSPHRGETSEVLTSYSAIQLFLQRAHQAEASFAPSAAEIADIGRICRLVEGMPLGLELAAPWIRTLSCREIAIEIQRNLDFLTTSLRNMPERHRSLKVVFEQTWNRLSTAEQSVLRQLSVFRGGCTREAAEQVTGATLLVLSSLVDKALLRRTNTGRYELHELIRQFAEIQLQTEPKTVDQAQQRHRDYFVAFLEARTAGVKGARQKEALAEIKADIDNVRLAWQQAMAEYDAQAIEQVAECLFVYYLYSSGHHEGQDAFGRAVAAFSKGLAFADVSDPPTAEGLPQTGVVSGQQENLAGFLMAGQGYFLARIRDPQAGQILLEQAVSLLRRAEPGDRRKQAFALLWLGWAFEFQGRNAKAQEHAEASLPLLSETGDRWGEAWSLLLWGKCTSEGRPAEAEQALTRALAVCRESGDQTNLGYIIANLGAVSTHLGRYAQAKQYIDQAIRTFEGLDSTLGRGYAFMRQGQLAIRQGEYRQAIQSLQQAGAYFDEARTLINAHWTRLELGTALHLQGDYRQAEQLYLQLLETFKLAHHQPLLARCLNCLGHLAYDQGELDRAEQFQRDALAILQQLGHEPGIAAAVLCHLGQVLVASGGHRHLEAKEHFRQALELATEHQLAPIALDVCVEVARLLGQSGKTEQAVQLLALAEQHEASTFETREKARQRLNELLGPAPSEAVRAARAQGRTLDWQTRAHQLIKALTVEAES